MRTPICKKKKKRKRGKRKIKIRYKQRKEGRKKKRERKNKKKKNLVVDRRINPVRGRGNGCPRLKVLQVPEGKKNAPTNVYDLRIRFDRCVCIEGNSVWVAFGVCVIQRLKALASTEP